MVKVVPWVTKRNISKIITANIEQGTNMVTDSYPLYHHLSKSPLYSHQIVNHSKDEYVNADGFHTNGVEGFFSILKRGLYGIYHAVSPKHLQKYCDEFALRYNTRENTNDDRFNSVIGNCGGRLKYDDLIKSQYLLIEHTKTNDNDNY